MDGSVNTALLQVGQDPVRGLDLDKRGDEEKITLGSRDKIEERLLPGALDKANREMKQCHSGIQRGFRCESKPHRSP
jgi:hypothetical protein